MFSEVFPILATADMAKALAFYRDQLGGKVSFEYPGPDGRPVYVGLDIGSTHLGIGVNPEVKAGPPPRPISLWVYTDNCDVAVQRLRESGAKIVEEPADRPWGERIARVLDPDGNEIIIGQRGAAQ